MNVIIKGTKCEIKWFQKLLKQHQKIDVNSQGNLYPARGSDGKVLDGVYRQDFGITKSNIELEKKN